MSDFRPRMVAAQRGTHVIARAYGTIGDESAPRLRQQPRGLTDDSTPLTEGGIVASTTVPDADPGRLALATSECRSPGEES